MGRFFNVDPLAESYVYNSSYAFSENRVVDGVELEGLEYKSVKNAEGNYTGFEWDPDNAYDDDGNLNSGYFEKAILFSQTDQAFSVGSWNSDKQRYQSSNVGTAKATVYSSTSSTDKDGNVTKTPTQSSYDFSTLPSDPNHFNTVASGLYKADFGTHPISGGYSALNVFTVNGNRSLPAVGGGTITGVNIHKSGLGSYTGTVWKKKTYSFNLEGGTKKVRIADQTLNRYGGVSEGCFICKRSSWNGFIGNFSSGDNVGVILQQRTFDGGDTTKPTTNPDVSTYKKYRKQEKIWRDNRWTY